MNLDGNQFSCVIEKSFFFQRLTWFTHFEFDMDLQLKGHRFRRNYWFVLEVDLYKVIKKFCETYKYFLYFIL